jgi:hypothetical protein
MRFIGLAVSLSLAGASVSYAQDVGLQQIAVTSAPITQFKIGSSETKFGRLTFTGGLEMTAQQRNFGALSAFRFLDAGDEFAGVTDTGFWFAGSVQRDEAGRPQGISGFRMNSMRNDDGGAFRKKWQADAEGLTVWGDDITVSYERVHRILTGKLDLASLTVELSAERLPVPADELRENKGFETLATSPGSGPLGVARVAVTEKSLDKAGNIFAAVLDGPKKGVFFVARKGEYDITDGDFLPNGDLLLLERRFNMADGIGMRLRLIPGGSIAPDATVDGDILLEADLAYQIDNMECLDVWQDSGGATVISLLSDDNHSILERNLLLEFKLD